jgi:uncharacterized protein YprB with RNaseH-like and TPR domain
MGKKYIIDIETFGLESMFDRIISIGVLNAETEEKIVFLDIEESVTLQRFWDYVKDADEWITFNGDSFDIPFLIRRSLINKVKVAKIPRHMDLRKIANGFWISYEKFGKGTLRDWATVLGETCETFEGNQMPSLFIKGDMDAIKKHNEEDLVITHKLYKLVDYCNLSGQYNEKK